MTLFSPGGATFGMSEEVILVCDLYLLMFALGYDSMTAILILFWEPRLATLAQ